MAICTERLKLHLSAEPAIGLLDPIGWCGHGHRRLEGEVKGLEPGLDERCGTLCRQVHRFESQPGNPRVLHPVDAEGAPIGAAHIPGDEIPALTDRHQLMWPDEPARRLAIAAGVVEADLLTVSACRRQHSETCGGNRVPRSPAQRLEIGVEGIDPTPETVGKNLFEFGHDPQGGVLDALNRRPGGGPQTNRQGNSFVVVD